MKDIHQQNNRHWQFSLLGLLLVPVGVMLAIIYYHEESSFYAGNPGSTLCQTLLQSNDIEKSQPTRDIPDTYNNMGSVDDRYVVVLDPKTGQMIIHDTLGGVGTNNTSVDGSRAQLAKDMISLEQYALQHKNALKPEDYDWLRRLARTGMQLAFGAPGIKPDLQLEAKQALLIEFHNLSSNPSTTMAHSEIFLQTEQASKVAETAYQQITDPGTPASSMPASSGSNRMISDVTGALGSLMALDPVSTPLVSMTGLPQDSSSLGTLVAQISPTLLTPSAISLMASSSPFNVVSGLDAIAVGANAKLSPAPLAGLASPGVDTTASTVVGSISSASSMGVAATNSNATVAASASSSDVAVNASASVVATSPASSSTSLSSNTSSSISTVSQPVSQSISSSSGVSATSSVSSIGTGSTGTTYNNWSSGWNTGATGSSYTYPTSSNSYTGFSYNTGTSGTTSTNTGGTTNTGSVQGYYQTLFNAR